jgi:hypothetical protein
VAGKARSVRPLISVQITLGRGRDNVMSTPDQRQQLGAGEPIQPPPSQPPGIEAEVSRDDLHTGNRALASQLLISGLASVAFSACISPVRNSFDKYGLTVTSSALFVIFFLTQVRFFIGDLLYLQDPELLQPGSGGIWAVDYLIIVIQSAILIFIGASASLSASAMSHYGFFDLLVFLYIMDILWYVVSVVLHLCHPALDRIQGRTPMVKNRSLGFQRPGGIANIDWQWAALSSLMIVAIVLPDLLRFFGLETWHGVLNNQPPSSGMLIYLMVVNVIAFIIDLFMLDIGNMFGGVQ